MLRLLLLVLYLAALSASDQAKSGGGWDPNGLTAPAPPTADSGGGWDPDGLSTPAPPADIGGGWDPNG